MRNVNRFLESVGSDKDKELHLPTIFSGALPTEADEVIEAMYVLGERRASLGDPVGIDEVTQAVRGLIADQRILDAAVDVCMQGLTASGYTEPEAHRLLLESKSTIMDGTDYEGSNSIADLLIETVRGNDRLPRDFGPAHSGGRARYELRKLIGMGSQGSVYEATDRAFAEQDSAAFVALKIFNTGEERRHTQEGSRARRIRHKNIARVIDQGCTPDDAQYVAYELIEGHTLEKWRSNNQEKLSAKAACRMLIPIAHGVQAAHSVGITHRDLKPANILINRDGEPVVTDFGIAHTENAAPQSDRRGTRGSLAFMAPEQYDGMVAGPMPSVDIYALGGILFWLVTGRYPNGDTVRAAIDWLEARADGGPGRILDWNVDERLHAIIAKSLSVDPASRYQSVESFAHDLEAYLEHRTIPWLDSSPYRRTILFTKRNPFVVMLLVVLASAVVLAAGIWVDARSTLRHERAVNAAAREIESLQSQLAFEKDRVENIKEKTALLGSLVRTWSSVLNAADDQGRIGTNLLFLHTVSLNEFVREDPVFLNELIAKKIEVGEQYLAQMETSSASPLQIAMWHEVLASWYINSDVMKAAEHLRATVNLLSQYAPADTRWQGLVQDQLEALASAE